MMLYIIKTIICSGLFFLFYRLVLEKAKLNRFKRFFLLLALLFSYVAPALEITVESPLEPAQESFLPITNPSAGFIPAKLPPTGNVNHNVALWIYCIVSVLLLARCIFNICVLLRTAGSNRLVQCNGAVLVLTRQTHMPYSFLRYIYVAKNDFLNNSIDSRILIHEAAHVRQLHSIDIILLELLQAVSWCNPFLYAYRKAMRLNHEFLADEKVINLHPDRASYQQLILQHAAAQNNFQFVSPFNFKTTKKRLLMISKNITPLSSAVRVIAAALVIAGMSYIIPEKSFSQEKKSQPPSTNNEIQKTTVASGASPALMEEFTSLVTPYRLPGDQHASIRKVKITDSVRNRLFEIYSQMSTDQQKTAPITFKKYPKPFQKQIITSAQVQLWKNAKEYGVWVDGKKINNELLNIYTGADFSHAFVSKLYGAAKKNVSYSYQVDLMTNDYYEKYYTKALADTSKYYMSIRALPPIAK